MTDAGVGGADTPALPLARRGLLRNTSLNFLGQILQLVTALAVVPFLLRLLGPERYGVYSLLTIVLTWLTLMDIGLSRGTLKFISEALGKQDAEPRAADVFWITVPAAIAVGLVTTALLAALSPWLVDSVFQLPAPMRAEGRSAFLTASFLMLPTLVTMTLIGVIEAHQRFDWSNGLRVCSTLLQYLLPLAGAYAQASLSVIVGLILAKQIVFMILHLGLSVKLMPGLRRGFRWDRRLAAGILRFGGWIAFINAGSLILGSLDRFLIGVFLTPVEVARYAVPQQVTNALLALPYALIGALFPALSRIADPTSAAWVNLFRKALASIGLAMSFISFALIAASRELLTIWIGKDFGDRGSLLAILACGLFLASLAAYFNTVLQTLGRVRTLALVTVLKIALQVLLTRLLLSSLEERSAAVAVVCTQSLELVLLAGVTSRATRLPMAGLMPPRAAVACALLLLLSGAILAVKQFLPPVSPWATLAVLPLVGIASLGGVWYYVLPADERTELLAAVRGPGPPRTTGSPDA